MKSNPHMCTRLGALAVAAIVFVTVGCAGKRVPEPMTAQQAAELKARLGNIAVVAPKYAPGAELQVPAKGALSGAGAGAVSGAMMPLELASGTNDGYAALFAIAFVPIGAVVGTVGGAITADSAEAVNKREEAIRKALADLKMQEALRGRVQAKAAELRTFPVTENAGEGPAREHVATDYKPLKAKGIDTVQEVAVQKMVLTGSGKVNPDLSVKLVAKTLMVSTADNSVLFARDYVCASETNKFANWAAAEGQLLRTEIERCYGDLAEKIVKDVYVYNGVR